MHGPENTPAAPSTTTGNARPNTNTDRSITPDEPTKVPTRVRDRLLDSLQMRGDENVLDLGCGSDLMLLGAAARTSHFTATGIDL